MNSLIKGLKQYWAMNNEDEKPRLAKKEPNVFFEGEISNREALLLATILIILAMAIVFVWSVGVMLV